MLVVRSMTFILILMLGLHIGVGLRMLQMDLNHGGEQQMLQKL